MIQLMIKSIIYLLLPYAISVSFYSEKSSFENLFLVSFSCVIYKETFILLDWGSALSILPPLDDN